VKKPWWTVAGPHYGAVLVMLVATFGFMAAAPRDAWTGPVRVALTGLTLLLALSTTPRVDRRLVWFIRALVLLALVSSIATTGASNDTTTGASAILTALLIALMPIVIVLGVVDEPAVTAQSIFGAICIYILLGMFFALVYGAIGAIGSGDFFAGDVKGTSNEFLYFSFVTLTTTGYGDFTAASNLGRTLAVTEALVGQLYIVTVLALIVTRFSGAVRRHRA
jgi:hypothetical protein